MNKELINRADADPAFTWDPYSIFASDGEWEAAVAELQKAMAAFGRTGSELLASVSALADLLTARDTLAQSAGKILIYAQMHWAVDTSDPRASAMMGRARALLAEVQSCIAFVEPAIVAFGAEAVRSRLANDTPLAVYEHYLDTVFRSSEHIRSAEVEELLGLLSDPFRTSAMTHSILADADLAFEPARATDPSAPPRPVAQGTIASLITDADREIRRTAFENYADAFLAHQHSMANALSAGVKQDVFNARVRRYASALEASLGRNFIPVDVFHNTVNTFRENLHVWHKYWRLRRRVLGFDSLKVYDIKAPLASARPVIPFEQAVEWIAAGMRPLGEEYVDALRRGTLEQRWVDVYPNKAKRSGAFSTGSPGTHPFILMSYADDVFSLSTLAHELGHSLHSYFTWKQQPFVYGRYSLFVAEVASNFNQALVRDYLLRSKPERDFQVALLEEAMSNYHRYFFIMPTLARFELEIHERTERGEALTAQGLNRLMADLFCEGYGEEVEQDEERVGITWAQFHTHLYSNFYVYQYTTGIAAANALAAKVLAGEDGAVAAYLDFLKTGNSAYPLDALQAAGVDMTSPEPVQRAFALLDSYIDRLERILLD